MSYLFLRDEASRWMPGRSTMALDQNQRQRSQYIDFWNSVLVPKFIRWKHILVDGLTLHSEAIFPTLAVRPGDKVVDAGCGFGDTAIKLAQLVGPSGSVLAVDCCDAFLDSNTPDVRFGSKADMCTAPAHVRFTPNSDIDCVFRHVRFGPKSGQRTYHSIT